MRMSHLASIVFACSISLFSTVSFAQSPAEDGLCSELLHGDTPSLYGLCIAYWATQNNGNSDASSKILEKYVARKSESDPGMPGLCPCWTDAELDEWKDKVAVNGDFCNPTIPPVPADGTLYWGTNNFGDSLQTSNVGQFACKTAITGALTNSGSPVNRPNDGTSAVIFDDKIAYEACFTSLSSICP